MLGIRLTRQDVAKAAVTVVIELGLLGAINLGLPLLTGAGPVRDLGVVLLNGVVLFMGAVLAWKWLDQRDVRPSHAGNVRARGYKWTPAEHELRMQVAELKKQLEDAQADRAAVEPMRAEMDSLNQQLEEAQPRRSGVPFETEAVATVTKTPFGYGALAVSADEARSLSRDLVAASSQHETPEPRFAPGFHESYEDFTGDTVELRADALGVVRPRTRREIELLDHQRAPRLDARVADDAVEMAIAIFSLLDDYPTPHPSLAISHEKPNEMSEESWQAIAEEEQRLRRAFVDRYGDRVEALLDEIERLGYVDQHARHTLTEVGITWATLNAVAAFLTGAAVRLRANT